MGSKRADSMDEKKTEDEVRKRTESVHEKENPRLEKKAEEEEEGRQRAGSMQRDKKKEEKEVKLRQIGRQRSETRSEQLSQVIGGGGGSYLARSLYEWELKGSTHGSGEIGGSNGR